MQTITEVSLKNCIIENSEHFTHFLDRLVKSLELETLAISHCCFKDETFEQLINTLIICPTLTWLFLSHNKLDDKHAKFIVNKFSYFRSLACLNLTGNAITEIGLSLICDNIYKCATLTKFVMECPSFNNIKERISSNLDINKQRIEKFHAAIMRGDSSEYKFALGFYPTLIDSYHNDTFILHTLVSNQKYINVLVKFLELKPSPYHTDINYSKMALDYAIDDNKCILINYIASYAL